MTQNKNQLINLLMSTLAYFFSFKNSLYSPLVRAKDLL